MIRLRSPQGVYIARAMYSLLSDTLFNDSLCPGFATSDTCRVLEAPGDIRGPDSTSVTASPNSVCSGGTYTFSISPMTGVNGYNWFTNIYGATLTASDTLCTVTFPDTIPMNAVVCVSSINYCNSAGLPKCKQIESGLPDKPDSINGLKSNVCGLSSVAYTAHSPKATSYTWTVSDTSKAQILNGNGTDSINVHFSSSLDSVLIFVSASNVCGSSNTDSVMIYGKPLLGSMIGTNISVCCGDTLLLPFTDTTISKLSINYIGTNIANDTTVDQINSTAEIELECIDLTSSEYAQVHQVIYDCTNNIYMDVDIAVSTNPSFMRIIICGNLTEDSVQLIASNCCGTDTLNLLLNDNCYHGDSCSTGSPRIAQQNKANASNSSRSLDIYPNPSTGNVTVQFNGKQDVVYSLTIQDISGRTLVVKKIKGLQGANLNDLDLHILNKGLYFVTLNSSDGKLVTRLMIE